MDRSWGHYAKWTKLEKDKYCIFSLICEKEKAELIETETRMVTARDEAMRMGKTGEGGQWSSWSKFDEITQYFLLSKLPCA